MNLKLIRTFALILAILASTATGASGQSTDEVAVLVDSGLSLLDKHNHLSAAKKFQKARELSNSKHPEPFLGFAALEIFRGKYVDAVAAAGKARSLTEDVMVQARADHLIGVAYHRLTWLLQDGPKKSEALKQAEIILREALEASGGELNEIRLHLAHVLTDKEADDEALALLREYLERHSDEKIGLEAQGLLCWLEHEDRPEQRSEDKPRPVNEITRPEKTFSPPVLLPKAARDAGIAGEVTVYAISMRRAASARTRRRACRTALRKKCWIRFARGVSSRRLWTRRQCPSGTTSRSTCGSDRLETEPQRPLLATPDTA